MPQHSQDVAQWGQSNQNLNRHQKLGSPGRGSASARSAVARRQAGQGGGRGVAIILIVVCPTIVTA